MHLSGTAYRQGIRGGAKIHTELFRRVIAGSIGGLAPGLRIRSALVCMHVSREPRDLSGLVEAVHRLRAQVRT